MSTIRRSNPSLPDSVFAMLSMRDKVAIITGGAGGIGYQVARGLAEAGANIALWYNTSTQAEVLAATIAKDFGVTAKAYQCDVQDFNKVSCFYFLQSKIIHPFTDTTTTRSNPSEMPCWPTLVVWT